MRTHTRSIALTALLTAAALALSLALVAPPAVHAGPAAASPPNDNFANATPIGALPFTTGAFVGGATREAGEPILPCGDEDEGTLWFAFKAPESRVYLADISSQGVPAIGIYTGAAVDKLTEVTGMCPFGNGGNVGFRATAGVTYYIQIGELAGVDSIITLKLSIAPEPTVTIIVWANGPAAHENILFEPEIDDPLYRRATAWSWSFGDGATSTEKEPSHAYVADGDYTVSVVITLSDGATLRGEKLVRVRTYDVAITKINAPNTARAGQSRRITVRVSNATNPVDVKLHLYRSVAGPGSEEIAAQTLTVPRGKANQTTTFVFSYTFTGEDAALGKVTFWAYAETLGAGDIQPEDNEAIAPPTRVRR